MREKARSRPAKVRIVRLVLLCSNPCMSEQEAKKFVIAMIEAGSNIQAIGWIGYVIVEPVDPDDEEAWHRISRVADAFGDVTHLKDDIIAYLHKIGRVEEINPQKPPYPTS